MNADSDNLNDLFAPSRVRSQLRTRLGDESLIKPDTRHLLFPGVYSTWAQAGVLIPLFEQDGQIRILLTRRNPTMRQHSGELSFPGGKRDPEDTSLVHTALREANEEVNLAPEDVEMFGAFSKVHTPSGFIIHSFVGEFQWPYDLVHNPDEVDYLVSPSLQELAAPGVHSIKTMDHDGQSFVIHHFDVEGPQPLWGATGFMVYELMRFLGHTLD